MKTLMIAEDLTALGQISLANALGVVQAQSVRPAMLPTALLSTQSEGFGTPVALSTEEWLENALAQWLDMGEEFAGILIGYVGQTALIDKLSSLTTLPCRSRLLTRSWETGGAFTPVWMKIT